MAQHLNNHFPEHNTHRADKMSGSVTRWRKRAKPGFFPTRGTKAYRKKDHKRRRQFLKNPLNYDKF